MEDGNFIKVVNPPHDVHYCYFCGESIDYNKKTHRLLDEPICDNCLTELKSEVNQLEF